jgi:hypothetical protein
MFLGLLDPHPDPLITSTDPAPDPAPVLYDFLSLKNDVNVPVFPIQIRMFLGLPDPHPDPLTTTLPDSNSGSIPKYRVTV